MNSFLHEFQSTLLTRIRDFDVANGGYICIWLMIKMKSDNH